MSTEEKGTEDKAANCCEGTPFAAMMEKMMSACGGGGEGEGCGCGDIMAKFAGGQGDEETAGEGAGCGCGDAMASCCAPQGETKEAGQEGEGGGSCC